MKAEIIAVGTELLLGQIVNTNAQFISKECAAQGIDVYVQTVVGDNQERLSDAFELAASRADVVICTGGLGPTQDDLTKDTLAALMGRTLSFTSLLCRQLQTCLLPAGYIWLKAIRRQALMIEGSDPLHNETGLAVGNAITFEGTHFILLPGPPKEMKPMFTNYAIPWLRAFMSNEVPLYSKMLKFAGIGESTLEHQLIDLIQSQSDPTLAPYAKEGEVTIRLTTRAHSDEEGERKIASTVTEIKKRLGDYLYADQDVPIETVVLALLGKKKQTLAVAESCTGGLLSDLLTAIPGSSQSFLGGIICYSNALKHKLLGVPMDTLEGEGAPGAVSSETAVILAEQLLVRTGSDFGISVTGVAGPSPSEGKPVGLVYLGLAKKHAPTEVFTLQLVWE